MKTLIALIVAAAALGAAPAFADRPFGSSDQGPPVHYQLGTD
jgi:hypothetical protein